MHAIEYHNNLEIIYPPLKSIQIYPQLITDFDKNIPSKPCHNHDQAAEPHEAKATFLPPVFDPTTPNT